MQPKPPARVPLLWILLPLIFGIALGRLLPIGPYYLLLVPSLTLGIFAWKASDRYPKRWARFLASSLLIAGYCYVNFADTQNKPRNNLPEREADLYVEIVRLFKTYGEKQKGIGRIIATDTLASASLSHCCKDHLNIQIPRFHSLRLMLNAKPSSHHFI